MCTGMALSYLYNCQVKAKNMSERREEYMRKTAEKQVLEQASARIGDENVEHPPLEPPRWWQTGFIQQKHMLDWIDRCYGTSD